MQVVFSGAGASAIACAQLYKDLGVDAENILMVDSKGVIYEGRTAGMNKYKQEFARRTNARTLTDAMKGADVFVGLSSAGLVTPEMVKAMAAKPIIFAMANPDPEITPPEVSAVRSDAIMATGRSDYPNQVNNVLGFPFIFRGALDVRARKINEDDEAGGGARARRAGAPRRGRGVPDVVRRAYPDRGLRLRAELHHPEALRLRACCCTWRRRSPRRPSSPVSRGSRSTSRAIAAPSRSGSWRFRASSRRASALSEVWRACRSRRSSSGSKS